MNDTDKKILSSIGFGIATIIFVAAFALVVQSGMDQMINNQPERATVTQSSSAAPEPMLLVAPKNTLPKGFGITVPNTGITVAPF